MSLSCDVKMMFRWVPSEFNAGDERSRVFDRSSSKSVMQYVGRNRLE